MQYKDVAWIMGVTITNLGFGDFTPSFWLSRTIGFIRQITQSFEPWNSPTNEWTVVWPSGEPFLNVRKVCLSSLFGIFQTALIVGVLSEALIIPPEEKRILALIEKQRLDKIRQNAAASLIQWSWRVYKYVYLGLVQNRENGWEW